MTDYNKTDEEELDEMFEDFDAEKMVEALKAMGLEGAGLQEAIGYFQSVMPEGAEVTVRCSPALQRSMNEQ